MEDCLSKSTSLVTGLFRENLREKWLKGKIKKYSDSKSLRCIIRKIREKKVPESAFFREIIRNRVEVIGLRELLDLEKSLWRHYEEVMKVIETYVSVSVLSPIRNRKESARFYKERVLQIDEKYYELGKSSPEEYLKSMREIKERCKIEIDCVLLEHKITELIKEIAKLMGCPNGQRPELLGFIRRSPLHKAKMQELFEYRDLLRDVSRSCALARKSLSVIGSLGYSPSEIVGLRPLLGLMNKKYKLPNELKAKFQEKGLLKGEELTELGIEIAEMLMVLDEVARSCGYESFEKMPFAKFEIEKKTNP